MEHVAALHPEKSKTIQPSNTTYRVVMFYSRSNVVPDMKVSAAEAPVEAKTLLTNPNFFFDLVYMHSKPSKENKAQQVFDFLTSLESLAPKDQFFYLSETCTKPKFHIQVAQLVAHPRLRPAQGDWPALIALDKVESEPKKK